MSGLEIQDGKLMTDGLVQVIDPTALSRSMKGKNITSVSLDLRNVINPLDWTIAIWEGMIRSTDSEVTLTVMLESSPTGLFFEHDVVDRGESYVTIRLSGDPTLSYL